MACYSADKIKVRTTGPRSGYNLVLVLFSLVVNVLTYDYI